MPLVDAVKWLGRRLMRRGRTADTPVEKPPLGHPLRLTREDVLRMIEENGGPEELDLSGRDLSWIDLSRDAISREAERITQQTAERPKWQNERNGGVDLRRVNLASANLFGANLVYADLYRARLEEAKLRAACLAKSWLRHTNLQNADLSRSDMSGARVSLANLDGANLSDADLTGADFDGASMRGASLYKAYLSGTKLSRNEIGSAVLQEDPADLRAFLMRHDPQLSAEEIDIVIRTRQLEEARGVYSNLKANFLETGNYDDASWAHVKERQMARRTHHPKHAKDYYGDECPTGRGWLPVKWCAFYLRHTVKWLLDWAAELTCGYGERPLRTVAWAGGILVLFPFLYAWCGGLSSMAGPLHWLDYFNYSFGAFTTMSFGQFEAVTPLTQTLTSLQALLGISTLALLMFALGNRISRS